MRYTTIIDIRECRPVYCNVNCRLVYLELTLAAGYHDHDRDIVKTSLRQLAARLGLTLSAVRHAVAQLEHYGLLKRKNDVWMVRKFVLEQPITPREKKARDKKVTKAEAERQRQQAELDKSLAETRRMREESASSGLTPFMKYVLGLKEKADHGDAEAAATFARHRKAYEEYTNNAKSEIK